jgi:DNA-binding MarR family transcriptional regulator
MSKDREFNRLGYLLQHVARLLSRQSEQVLQERLGIGMSQFKILRVIQANPQIKQRQIANILGQTEASVSRQVKLMIDDGLLRSLVSPRNRRAHMTVITAKGERLNEAAMDALSDYHGPTFETLNKKQREQLSEVLQVIHDKICVSDHPDMVVLPTSKDE